MLRNSMASSRHGTSVIEVMPIEEAEHQRPLSAVKEEKYEDPQQAQRKSAYASVVAAARKSQVQRQSEMRHSQHLGILIEQTLAAIQARGGQ